jgi:histidine ammonia-lyase
MTHAPQAAQKLTELLWRFRLVIAIELLVAAQAVDLRGIGRLGRGTARAQAAVRDIVPPLDDDRPLGADVERIAAELLATGRLLEIVHKTL